MISKTFYLMIWGTFLSSSLACSSDPTTTSNMITVQNGFDRPQSLLFHGSELVVGSSGYRPNNWQDGTVSFLDWQSGEITRAVQTHALNPQKIKSLGPWLAVVETGRFDFTDFDDPKSVEPFGVELISTSHSANHGNPFVALPSAFELGSVSAPVDIATLNDVSLITSGLFNVVWRVRWASVEAGSVDSVDILPLNEQLATGLGSITTWNSKFLVADFNEDYLHLINAEGERVECSVHIGEDESLMEGLQTPLVVDDVLYVSFAFSGTVRRIDLRLLADNCSVEAHTLDLVLGQVPNDMDRVNNQIWITESGENRILKVDLDSETLVDSITLPISSNPWHLDVNLTAQRGAVTLWGIDAIGFFNLEASSRD